MTDNTEMLQKAEDLVAKIKPMFIGQDPGVVSAALCDLTSMWLVGWPEPTRERLFDLWVVTLWKLVAVNAEKLAAHMRRQQLS